MPPQLWQEVKVILGEALKRNEGEPREKFVAEACAHDPTLRREVDTYLAVSDDETLEACAENLRESLMSNVWSPRIGQRIGAYRIVREIGRGGMGTVFLAARADGQFEKQVAIKLLKRGTDTDEIVRRFRSERQILAKLDHPGIARLLDAGCTEDGLPYFVMEFVEGLPITQFVRERSLSIDQRLELFLKVCSAVERSHRDRIVHRDLKPSNILVTAEGEPKILDFGIAKLLEPGQNALEKTVTSQQRFTATCVSPEQARGEQVTVASDIYALGALLYEMLSGCTPHQFSTPRPSSEELARVVCDQEPKLPSQTVEDREARRRLEGDLDNIVLCALRKDPAKRYATVHEFEEDIRRHRSALPIQARPRTAVYRLQRFWVRRKGVRSVAGFAAALIVLLAGFVLFIRPGLRNGTRGGEPSKDSATAITDQKSIAVLPFESLGNQADEKYFVDGMQDNILTDLSKVSDLKVISRSAVEHYRGEKKSASAIGRALNVAHVLEGSVQKSGDRVRVNVRLIDTRTEAQTWSEAYERTVADVFALQSELAQSIATQLKATLSPEEKAAIERRPTEDMQAYDLYLRARDLMTTDTEVTPAVYHKMLDLIDAAITRDPNFALAYCFATEVHVLLYRYREHTPERLVQAKEAAAMALQLAPDLGESHLAQAVYYYHGLRDYYGAERELKLADSKMNGKPEFLLLKQLTERRFGHWKDALRDGKKAVELAPRDPSLANVLIQTYRVLRMYSEGEKLANDMIAHLPANEATGMWAYKCDFALAAGAVDKAREVIGAVPDKAQWKTSMLATMALYRRNYPEAVRLVASTPESDQEPSEVVFEAQVQRLLGDAEKSKATFERARKLLDARIKQAPDDPNLYTYLAMTQVGLGQKDDAFAAIQRAATLAPMSQDSIDAANWMGTLAEVYVLSGDPDAALAQLAKVVQLPNGPVYGDLLLNPEWDPIRDRPAFQKILAQAAKPPVYN